MEETEFTFQVKKTIFSTYFSPTTSFPLLQAPPPAFVIGSLDRKAVDVHGELPEVAADPGPVEDTTENTKLP